jgi:hypothetical protein
MGAKVWILGIPPLNNVDAPTPPIAKMIMKRMIAIHITTQPIKLKIKM